MSVDFSPIVEYLWGLFALVMSGSIGLISAWLAKFIREKTAFGMLFNEAMILEKLNNGMERGLALGRQKIDAMDLTVDIKNQIAAVAVDYIVKNSPDTVRALGVTEQQLAQRALAQLEVILKTEKQLTDETVTTA